MVVYRKIIGQGDRIGEKEPESQDKQIAMRARMSVAVPPTAIRPTRNPFCRAVRQSHMTHRNLHCIDLGINSAIQKSTTSNLQWGQLLLLLITFYRNCLHHQERRCRLNHLDLPPNLLGPLIIKFVVTSALTKELREWSLFRRRSEPDSKAGENHPSSTGRQAFKEYVDAGLGLRCEWMVFETSWRKSRLMA